MTVTDRAPAAYNVALGATALAVMTLPFAHSVAVRNIALAIALIATPFAWRAFNAVRPPLVWFFALLGALGAASLLWSVDPAYSRSELKSEVLYPLIVFLLTFLVARDRRALGWLGVAMAIAAAFGVAGALAAWDLRPWADRPLLFNGPGFYSTWVTIAFPFALAATLAPSLDARWRRVAGGVVVLLIVGGLATLNRMLPLVFAVQTVLLVGWDVLTRRDNRLYLRIVLALSVAITLLGTVVLVQNERVARKTLPQHDVAAAVERDVRWPLWRDAAHRIAVDPWRGAGFGRGILRKELRDRHAHHQLWHAHNVVLNYGLQLGMPGMALIVGLFGAALWHLGRAYRACDEAMRPYVVAALVMVVGVFLKNQADDFFVRQTALAFWAALGAILGVAARVRRNRAGA